MKPAAKRMATPKSTKPVARKMILPQGVTRTHLKSVLFGRKPVQIGDAKILNHPQDASRVFIKLPNGKVGNYRLSRTRWEYLGRSKYPL